MEDKTLNAARVTDRGKLFNLKAFLACNKPALDAKAQAAKLINLAPNATAMAEQKNPAK